MLRKGIKQFLCRAKLLWLHSAFTAGQKRQDFFLAAAQAGTWLELRDNICKLMPITHPSTHTGGLLPASASCPCAKSWAFRFLVSYLLPAQTGCFSIIRVSTFPHPGMGWRFPFYHNKSAGTRVSFFFAKLVSTDASSPSRTRRATTTRRCSSQS